MSDERKAGAGLAAATGSEIPHVDDWVRDMGFDDNPEDGDVM